MAKAQLIVAVDHPDEVRAITDWFERWRGRLAAVSKNTGCGCCVDIWTVEGPAEAFRELPDMVVTYPGIEAQRLTSGPPGGYTDNVP